MRKVDLKPPGAAYSAVLDKCRPEVAGDVIYGITVEQVGMNVRAKLGHFRSSQTVLETVEPLTL